jgi:prepilin-type N-terminal cleavage/methylation domain-containing protein
MPNKSAGFTLIEILVAVAILAILSALALVIFKGADQKARLAKVQQDFDVISKEIQISRESNAKSLCEITGPIAENNNCVSDWLCRGGTTKVNALPSCYNQVTANWAKITGKPYLQQPLPTGPWGNIYVYDENEEEPNFNWDTTTNSAGGPNWYCRYDMMRSAGPDGVDWTPDDYYAFVPPFHCKSQEFPELPSVQGTWIHNY